MKIEYRLFIKSELLDCSESQSLAKAIVSLGLKRKDIVRSIPFNHYGDEDTDYKPDPKSHQVRPLIITSIEYYIMDSWNGTVRSRIDIYLV